MSAFAGADADDFLDRVNENDSVADVPGLRRLLDGIDRLFNVVIAEDDIELNARQEIHPICSGPPGQLNAALAAMPAHFSDVHPDDPDFVRALP